MDELNYLWVQIHFKEDGIPSIHAGKLTEESKKELERLIKKRELEARFSERAWTYKNMRDHGADPNWVELAKARHEKLQKELDELKD